MAVCLAVWLKWPIRNDQNPQLPIWYGSAGITSTMTGALLGAEPAQPQSGRLFVLAGVPAGQGCVEGAKTQ